VKRNIIYFFTTVAGGDEGGAGKPVPVEGRFRCEFSTPDKFGGGCGAGYSEAGQGGYAKTRPSPAPLPCLYISMYSNLVI